MGNTTIAIISDTHNQHSRIRVPDADILIHCGDATTLGTLPEIHDFYLWWNSLPHKYKIFVPGNHDFGFMEKRHLTDTLIPSVQDSLIETHGLRIWGSPWTPNFGGWAFMLPEEKLSEKWDLIPDDIDILITHGPPMGILDQTLYENNAGSPSLRAKVMAIKPKIHAFGHIHEGYGDKIDSSGVRFVNAAICDVTHTVANTPHLITL